MIPSGEVYDHDCVRWYHYQDLDRHIDHAHNIGDAFVYDSSLKLLNFEKVEALPIDKPEMAHIDALREKYDYVLLRGSNYLHGGMNWRNSLDVLRRLRLPVLCFGVGAQAPTMGPLELSEQTKDVVRLIADSTTSIGVRGAYTAQVLWDIGVRNVRIVGCPTAFRANDPTMRIVVPPIDQVERMGVTVRRGVSDSYAKDIQHYLVFHRELIKNMARRFDVILMAQGEVPEKKIVLGTESQREGALASLRKHAWFGEWYIDDEIERLYRSRLFYSDVVADYERLVRTQNWVLGYRLHGNLMALANGVPSVYFTYDSRTAEFAETFQIPSFDVFSGREFVFDEYLDQSLFDRFNRAWFAVYRETQVFLSENGVDHRMVDVMGPQPSEVDPLSTEGGS